jgi:DNA-binding transcriptional MocR family regulator
LDNYETDQLVVSGRQGLAVNNQEFVKAITPWLGPNEGPLRAHLSLAIRQAISTGQLPQGVRLPPERAMAASLHVSRPTISGVIEDLRRAGLVSSRQGSGSWVSGGEVSTSPPVPFAELVQSTGSIDLASATAPDASLIPSIRVETGDLLTAEPANGLTPAGMWELRAKIAARATVFEPVPADNVLMTSGAHQALALIVAALTTPGSTVLLEETTYGGLVDMVHANGCHPVAIPRDHDGPVPEELARLLERHRPALTILIASVHSPSGTISSPERNRDLAAVLLEAETPVVLDETYSELEFVPSGRELARALGSRAIRTGSLSKSLWTGLRTGWIIADRPTCLTIGRRRWQQFDLGPSVAAQLFASQALDGLDNCLAVRRPQLIERSTWMLDRIAERFPRWAPWRAEGGLAMWIELPEDGQRFVAAASAQGVAVLPGAACRTDQKPTNHIRICFDRPIDVLEEAFDRLELV